MAAYQSGKPPLSSDNQIFPKGALPMIDLTSKNDGYTSKNDCYIVNKQADI